MGALLVDLDGPLTRLFPAPSHLEAAGRLLATLEGWGEPGPPAPFDHTAILRACAPLAPDRLRVLIDLATSQEFAAARVARPAEGAHAFLRRAQRARIPVAVVSNNDTRAVWTALDACGLAPFVRHVAARKNDMTILKPDPALVEAALAALGVPAEDSVLFGDSVSDVEAGRAAGVPVVGVTRDPQRMMKLLDAGAVAVVPTLAEAIQPSPLVTRVAETRLPTRHGTFRMVGYRGYDGTEHVALSMGVTDDAAADDPVPVRLHSECLTGDALGSRRCDCGDQLQAALAEIAASGRGALVYVRGHEGRGIGLLEKLKAYHLQDEGMDTVDANLALGHPADTRDYAQAAAILADLGLTRVRLMSSNPTKSSALAAHGIEVVERSGMFVPEHPENVRYLATKRARMHHDRPPAGGAWEQLLDGTVPATATTTEDQDLLNRYGPLVGSGPLVVAQLAQSLDGFIATASGESAGLSGPEDHTHLHRLRALVDAVLVGATTVEVDDPRLTVREVPGRGNPTRVVLDPRGRVPAASLVFTDGEAPTLWLVGPDAEVVEPSTPGVEVVRLDGAAPSPTEVLAVLRERGLSRVLVEGGGRTVSSFLDAGALDRLFVTTVPVFLGDGVPGLRVSPVGAVRDLHRTPTRRFQAGDDTVAEFVLR